MAASRKLTPKSRKATKSKKHSKARKLAPRVRKLARQLAKLNEAHDWLHDFWLRFADRVYYLRGRIANTAWVYGLTLDDLEKIARA